MKPECTYTTVEKNELQTPQPSLELQAGEPEKEKFFGNIYKHNWYKVYSYAYVYTGSKEEAEDMAQEVFLKLWLQFDRISSILKNAEGYLFIMARNSCHTHYKKEVRKRPLYKNYCQSHKDAYYHDEVVVKEISRIALKAVQKLPEKQKKVFIYRDMGLGRKEIADIMKVSVNTIDNSINIAMKKVQQYVSRELELSTAA
ncbi:RNA polymerase sigma factor [Niastella caeni]|nr:sigma-70 family RNA polymerase sigma factor [Niastella caeni]